MAVVAIWFLVAVVCGLISFAFYQSIKLDRSSDELRRCLKDYGAALIEASAWKQKLAEANTRLNHLEVEHVKLVDAVKKHHAQTGQNLCWENDVELWAVLGLKPEVGHLRPPAEEFYPGCLEHQMKKCLDYWKSRPRVAP